MVRERRLFSEEFKREAVKLVGQPGASKAAIARDLGIGANLLGRSCRDANVDAEVAVALCSSLSGTHVSQTLSVFGLLIARSSIA